MYNFYIFILCGIILKILILNLRKDILQKISIFEESLIVYLFLGMFMLLFFTFKKGSLLTPLRKLTQLDRKSLLYIVIIVFLILTSILMSGFLIQNENIPRYQIFKQAGYIVLVFFIAYLYKQTRINSETIIGVILVILGLYIVDKQFKQIETS